MNEQKVILMIKRAKTINGERFYLGRYLYYVWIGSKSVASFYGYKDDPRTE